MRSPNNNGGRRSRNRSGRRPQQHNRNTVFESNGPDTKVRGTASQVYEKYTALARDAASASDHVRAEGLLQHAEHYLRLVNASKSQEKSADKSGDQRNQSQGQAQNPNDRNDQPDAEAGDQPQPSLSDGNGEGDGNSERNRDNRDQRADKPRRKREQREPREPRGRNSSGNRNNRRDDEGTVSVSEGGVDHSEAEQPAIQVFDETPGDLLSNVGDSQPASEAVTVAVTPAADATPAAVADEGDKPAPKRRRTTKPKAKAEGNVEASVEADATASEPDAAGDNKEAA